MKVSVVNGDRDILEDPIKGRPFSFNLDRIEYCKDHSKSDYIFGYLHYLDCNKDYNKIIKTEVFKKYADKFVFWSMHDSPRFAYKENKSTKFICQPLHTKKINNKYNVIPVPLQMRHYELEMIKDLDFIKKCRNQEKEYDFIFVGQVRYAGRNWLRNFNADSYYFEETRPIWGKKDLQERVEMNKEFCLKLSKARYGFAPRGAGSSSFRLFQCLMSGTVPIVSGMKHYPFSDFIDWSDIVLEGRDISKEGQDMIIGSDFEDRYQELRANGIEFWDKYVRIPKCDRVIFERYLDEQSGN